MIRVLIDTNILVDFLARREPFYGPARSLMVFAAMGDYELWMSASQVADLFYILSNGGARSSSEACKAALRGLRAIVHVAAPGEREVDAALAAPWEDFEASLVCQTAIGLEAQAIVTRNGRDFTHSPIPVFDVDAFFEWMEHVHHVAYGEIRF